MSHFTESCRVWFWLQKSAGDYTSTFNWRRDDIYIPVALFGVGGATISVMSLSFLALLVGEYSVGVYST